MKVLFIYSHDDVQPEPQPLPSWTCIQPGISYLSSVLKRDGHQTRLQVLGSAYYKESIGRILSTIAIWNPGLICFTAVFSQYRFIEEIAQQVKRDYPGIFLIVGGVHATLQPDEVMAGPFDALCIGEGEYPLRELCRQVEAGETPQGISNLWLRTADGTVEKNSPRDFIQDLDRLPFPDYALWEPFVQNHADDEMVIVGGRGCPYDCTYCCNHALRKVAGGAYVRMRSPENIRDEVAFLCRKYPHRRFYLEIETLDCNKRWTLELCDKLAEFNASAPAAASFGSNFRINPQTIDEEIFCALEKANFTTINIGLESGSERIRRDILKRSYTNEDFLRVVSLARNHGMKVFVYNMIGLPGESLKDHRETVRLNRHVQPDGHFTGIFFPYPGTKLYDVCREKGLLDDSFRNRSERRQPVLSLPDFSKSQIKRAHIWFNYHIYRGYRPLREILRQVGLTMISANPAINHRYRRVVRFLKTDR